MKESVEAVTKPSEMGVWERVRNLFRSRGVAEFGVTTEAGKSIDAAVPTEVEEPGGVSTYFGIESGTSPETVQSTYLERLAALDFEVEGNPNLKRTFQSGIEGWQNSVNRLQLFRLAEQMNKSVEEVEALLQQRIEAVIERSHFFCATDSDVLINHILRNEKRYKSSFELGDSPKITYDYRGKVENRLFGFPLHDTIKGKRVKSKRPIYGYFSMNSDGVFNSTGTHPPWNHTHAYGRVAVKIKRPVAVQRATFSLADSYYIDPIFASPVALPHFSAVLHSEDEQRLEKIRDFLENPLEYKTFFGVCGGYTEVQYHGGLRVGDIESIHLSEGNGLDPREIFSVVAAVNKYNRTKLRKIAVVIY